MALLAVERFEGFVEIIGTFLQLLDEIVTIAVFLMGNLNEVNVLQTVVVAVDVILVGALTDIQHTHILTIDIEHGRVAGLPVEVGMAGHGALDDSIAEVEVAEVVTTVAQRERLELLHARLLVGEELIDKLLVVGVEALVGIECQRLQCIGTRLSTLDAELAELIEGTFLTFFREELNVHGAAPVVRLLVLLALVVGKQTNLAVIQIFVVGLDGEDGERYFSWVEHIRLGGAHG